MYDLAIVGAGPAGLSASIYASRYGVKNIVIGEPGGLAAKTHEIGNWLGTEKITGSLFAQNCEAHAKSYGAEIKYTLVKRIEGQAGDFTLHLDSGQEVKAKAVLLAMGTAHKHLEVKGEKEFSGKGVSYCATCDGFFYKGKTVAIIGGNDSAAGAAVFMGDIAEKVYIIYRQEALRAEKFWLEKIEKNPKIEIICNMQVTEIRGNAKLEELALDKEFNGADILKADGLFIEIGFVPTTELVKGFNLELDEEGYIKIDAEGKTTAAGIWAAGDITNGSNKFKQIVTAAAEGAIAARSVQKNIRK